MQQERPRLSMDDPFHLAGLDAHLNLRTRVFLHFSVEVFD